MEDILQTGKYVADFRKRLEYYKYSKQEVRMTTINRKELKALTQRLGAHLVERKALNSKVTSKDYQTFQDAVEGGADLAEIKAELTRLEQSLKNEGLFKNVKTEFARLKKDLINVLHNKDEGHTKSKLPGIHTTAVRDKTFYVSQKEKDDLPVQVLESPKVNRKLAPGVSSIDMKMLNGAISKLFRHLQINAPKDSDSKTESREDLTAQKENLNILSLSQEDNFHDIVLKLKNFEKEFQRQKVIQHREIMRLQDEVKRLNKNAQELQRENERFKGVHPIANKANHKQVERMEERFQKEKKVMDGKILELEDNLKRRLEWAVQEKEELKHTLKEEMEYLSTSVSNLSTLVHGSDHEAKYLHHNKYRDDDDPASVVASIVQSLSSVTTGVQNMKAKNLELTRKVIDVADWQKAIKDVDREITKFTRVFTPGEDNFTTHVSPEDLEDPHKMSSRCKNKLKKTKDNLHKQLKGAADSTSILKHRERDIDKMRRNMDEISEEVARIHDAVITAQVQDISVSMSPFDRKSSITDELPEAERMDHLETLDKLKTIGSAFQHYQQLYMEKTTNMSKLENDFLPLKIRVNRLHELLAKNVSVGSSPEIDDPLETLIRTPRDRSPELIKREASFSKDISALLTKLSKMELGIKRLIDQAEIGPR